jgi:hypothetical protein
MAKSKKDVAAPEPQVLAAPPEGFRELTKEEAVEFENFSLRLAAALERRMRWSAEVELAKGKEQRAKNEVAALEVVAQQMDAKLGIVDAQKDVVSVGGKVYVRQASPVTPASEGSQPLPRAEITVKPGPT